MHSQRFHWNRAQQWRALRRIPAPSYVSQPHPPDHNGGPPLDDPEHHSPEWGRSDIRTYFAWKRAYQQVWKSVPRTTMLRRLKKARACGLTYEEYTLHLLDTGRYLQPDDHDVIREITARRYK